jgi:cbb3-type cytochrome oxidase subunit 1
MANIDRWFLRIAVIYALVAMLLGITMGMREDFTQAPTHAHLNLVGWVSMALYALVYRQYPEAAKSRLALLHFWVANIGAVLLAVGIYTQMAGMPSLVFIVISGSFITILGMLIFAVIIYSKV